VHRIYVVRRTISAHKHDVVITENVHTIVFRTLRNYYNTIVTRVPKKPHCIAILDNQFHRCGSRQRLNGVV